MEDKRRTCRTCGNTYPATTDYFRKKPDRIDRLDTKCIFCAREYDRLLWCKIRDRRKKKYRETYRETHIYKVIKDPDPVGGFPSGASFDSISLRISLEMGNFTPGSVIKARTHQYIVVGGIDSKQKLIDQGVVNERRK